MTLQPTHTHRTVERLSMLLTDTLGFLARDLPESAIDLPFRGASSVIRLLSMSLLQRNLSANDYLG